MSKKHIGNKKKLPEKAIDPHALQKAQAQDAWREELEADEGESRKTDRLRAARLARERKTPRG